MASSSVPFGRILVCGDSMIDRYQFGTVERISPEAPVPVVKMGRVEDRPGAAANVTANCMAMGAACDWLYSPSTNKVTKIRVIAKQQQVVRVDFDEPQEPVDLMQFEKKAAAADVIVFSDYGKGALIKIRNLIAIAKHLQKIVLVDPKGHDYQRYAIADVIKPNLNEIRDMVGGWSNEDQLSAKAERLRFDSGVGAILLTRAAQGMTLFEEGSVTHIPCVAKDVFDVSGAGDTAIAALAVALTRGYSLVESSRYANKAAGIAVGRFGTSVVTEQEVFG